jgi:hypothetical protein
MCGEITEPISSANVLNSSCAIQPAPNQVTTMPGLKNSSIGCNRPTPRRMLHRC